MQKVNSIYLKQQQCIVAFSTIKCACGIVTFLKTVPSFKPQLLCFMTSKYQHIKFNISYLVNTILNFQEMH